MERREATLAGAGVAEGRVDAATAVGRAERRNGVVIYIDVSVAQRMDAYRSTLNVTATKRKYNNGNECKKFGVELDLLTEC